MNDTALFAKVEAGETLSPEERAALSSVANARTGEILAQELFEGGLSSLSPEVSETLFSPKFKRLFISLGRALAEGKPVVFDIRNFLDEQGRDLITGQEAYFRLLSRFARSYALSHRKPGLILLDCRKDGMGVKNAAVDNFMSGIKKETIHVERELYSENILDDIKRKAPDVASESLKLIVHEENFHYFRACIGKLFSLLVVLFDGKVLDIGKEKVDLIEELDSNTAQCLRAAKLHMVPTWAPAIYPIDQIQKAAEAFGAAA